MRSKVDGLDRTLASLRKELEGETVKFINKFDESLSHLIFAGSDIVLCQSYHDPLHQLPLKALRYGAAPLTLTPKENFPRHFIDQEPDTTKYGEFISSYLGSMSLSEALDEIKRNPSNWKQRMVGCMRKDFSWDAECYDIHVSAYTDIKKL